MSPARPANSFRHLSTSCSSFALNALMRPICPVSAVVNFASGLCTCTTIDSLPPRAPNGYRSSRWLILPICSVILCWSSLSIVCNCTRSWSILSSEFMYSTFVASSPITPGLSSSRSFLKYRSFSTSALTRSSPDAYWSRYERMLASHDRFRLSRCVASSFTCLPTVWASVPSSSRTCLAQASFSRTWPPSEVQDCPSKPSILPIRSFADCVLSPKYARYPRSSSRPHASFKGRRSTDCVRRSYASSHCRVDLTAAFARLSLSSAA